MELQSKSPKVSTPWFHTHKMGITLILILRDWCGGCMLLMCQHPSPTSSSNRPSLHLGVCLPLRSEPAHGWVYPHLAERSARWLTPSPGTHSDWLRGRHVTQIGALKASQLNLPPQRRFWSHGVHCGAWRCSLHNNRQSKGIQRNGVIKTWSPIDRKQFLELAMLTCDCQKWLNYAICVITNTPTPISGPGNNKDPFLTLAIYISCNFAKLLFLIWDPGWWSNLYLDNHQLL